ncbi:hypothetical protein CPHO_01180 [Corynebacterium phocae]|uniref:Type II secretion system protein GspF domain-containing protein n=2 Tax=Corynebacterium phocae TaxID=161895 RepID=A0A1L7D634_9CORY|nr:hypothetical protein CPHO_01180 [Corynebacterium phocae]
MTNTLSLLLAAAALLVRDTGHLRRRTPSSPFLFLALCAVVFVVTLAFLRIGRVSVLVAAAIAGLCAAKVWQRERAHRAAQKRNNILAGYLGILTAELRAGATFPTALAHAADSLPTHASEELRLHLRAAAHLAAADGEVDLAFGRAGLPSLAATVRLARHHGISLAPLVGQVQTRLDTADAHSRTTAASLQGPRATALVLSCLPLLGLAMGSAMGAHPVAFLTGGGVGGWLLVAGTALAGGGFVWSQAIIARAAGASS